MKLPVKEPITKNAVPGTSSKDEFPLQEDYVYGPIYSRRLGCSLGINPLPVTYKFCDFDCVYCQYGWTPEKGNGEKLLRKEELLKRIESEFRHHAEIKTPIVCITIAGNGEPTLYPDFLELCQGLLKLRDQYFPKAKVGILCDSSQVHRPEIREALMLLDERYMKLDAGDRESIDKINRPKGNFDFNRMIEGLSSLNDYVIQTLFMQGSYDNTGRLALESWIKQIKKLKPREVQVYTIDRKPADSGLRQVSAENLRKIAAECQDKTGVSCIVYE